MAPLDIPRLTVGERVTAELLVREREDKTTRNGDPYVVFKLGNATGALVANVWKEQVAAVQGVRPGQVVQVIGVLEDYQGRRSLKLTSPPRIVPKGAEDLDAFLPRAGAAADALWAKVDAWRGEMRGALRRAVDTVFADEAFREAFARTPGAVRGHHAVVGGLLLHSCEVAEIARAGVRVMAGDVALVTAGALLHDIGKVEAYRVDIAGFDYTREGQLLGHIVLGSLMLDRRLLALPERDRLTEEQRLELHHFIQSHHGIAEFGAAVPPMTMEAEILHYADQISSKGNDFAAAADDPELFPGDTEFSVRRHWQLGRRLWKRQHRWD